MPAANDDKTEKTKKGRGVDTNTGSRYKSAPTFIPVDLDKKPESLMKYALRTSLGTGVSIDTKFYAYSRRKASQPGTMFAPRAVYANSLMLRARLPSYFDPLLGGWYGKNVVEGSLDAPFPEDFADETEKYDYDSDSDIEDDDEADTVLSKSSETSLTKAADANKESDDKDTHVVNARLGTNGRTLLMPNHAYSTWRAFIYYLYTDEITFAPLKSQLRGPSIGTFRVEEDLSCSPKSIYRLAHELGYEELKKKAKADIQSKLSANNILIELFSTFSCTYEDILDMEIERAVEHHKDTVGSDIPDFLQHLSADDLKRCTDVVSRLVVKLVNCTKSPSRGAYCSYCDRNDPTLKCAHCNRQLG